MSAWSYGKDISDEMSRGLGRGIINLECLNGAKSQKYA